jgi:hypothetical protein
MTLLTNLGTNTATTKDWLEVTKNQSISELIPHNLGTETSTRYQVTAKGPEISVHTNEKFVGDLEKASHRSSRVDK